MYIIGEIQNQGTTAPRPSVFLRSLDRADDYGDGQDFSDTDDVRHLHFNLNNRSVTLV
jgi:hypothetical protein